MDVVVGLPIDVLPGDPAPGSNEDAGAVYLFPGGQGTTTDDATLVLLGTTASGAGESLADAGNALGDGARGLVIGALGVDGVGGDDYDEGAAYLAYGPLLGDIVLADAGAEFIGEADGDGVGQGLEGPGDMDGDGLDDVVVGAPVHGVSGAVYVVVGVPTGKRRLERRGRALTATPSASTSA